MKAIRDENGMVFPNVALAILLIFSVFMVSLWDTIALGIGRPEATVSEIIGAWSARFPILPVAFGVLIGHLFWPRN